MNEGPRIIVCGGRDYADRDRVYHEIQRFRGYDPVIVHGAAHGADRLADEVATELGLATGPHPAMWDLLGRCAGIERNKDMARLGADLCIAFPGGRGTADMIRRAETHGIPVRRVDS